MSYLTERLARKNGLSAPLPTKKERKPIAKISEKLKKKQAEERKARGDDDTELQKWFKSQIKRMNVCEETGMKLETNIYKYAIMSVCHILPKAQCDSVRVHPLNRLFLLPDLHFKWDNSSWEEREKWSVWPVVQERLIMIYPSLDPSERRFFPSSVLDYIEKNNPF